MFVRKKVNRSGTTRVVVIDKGGGTFRHVKSFGSSSDPDEVRRMCEHASDWIMRHGGQQLIEFDATEQAKQAYRSVLSNVERTLQNAPQAILGRVYDDIGFNAIGDDILRHLAISRVCQPMSKVATADYLKSYFGEDVRLHNIYRYMDKLYSTQRELVQRISVEHTMKVLGGRIGVMFYDVTTLYFEADREDDLRKTGFSKEGRHKNPQIILDCW